MKQKMELSKLLYLILGALLAGFFNGLLGAGGGIVLYFVLAYVYGKSAKENLMLSSVSVMFFCIVSLFFYKGNSALHAENILKLCLPAISGGVIGAFLLKKLPQNAVKKLFSAVIIIGGILMLFK